MSSRGTSHAEDMSDVPRGGVFRCLPGRSLPAPGMSGVSPVSGPRAAGGGGGGTGAGSVKATAVSIGTAGVPRGGDTGASWKGTTIGVSPV
jgi:hypothetical protein